MQEAVAVAELLIVQAQPLELVAPVSVVTVVRLYHQQLLAAMEQQTEVVVVEVAPMELHSLRAAAAALA